MWRRHLPNRLFFEILAGLALALLCIAMGACRRQAGELPTLLTPQGSLTTGRQAVCSPGPLWEKDPPGDDWRFRGAASIYCWIGAVPSLKFTLQADRFTDGFRMRPTWDGKPLSAEPVTMRRTGVEIAIPAKELTPGRHDFHLVRVYERVAGRHPHPIDNGFTRFGYTNGKRTTYFGLRRLPRWRYLSEFLSLGIAGRGQTKRSGWLFDGPERRSIDVAAHGPTKLRLTVENASPKSAVFKIAAGPKRQARKIVPRNETADLALSLGPGRSQVEMQVDGSPHGLYLWGDPRFARVGEPSRFTAQPPVIFLTLDTTRRDALGLYSKRSGITPNLDAFAKHATVFTHAVSTSPWTLPSHASMFTGLYPSEHGAGLKTMRLMPRFSTLAKLLAASGYRTEGVIGGELCKSRFGLGTGFQHYRDPTGISAPADELTAAARRVLANRGEQPLFLFINYFDAHGPYRAPAKFRKRLGIDRLRQGLKGMPLWQRMDRGDIGAWLQIVKGKGSHAPAALAYVRADYEAEVAFMDDQIGRLFSALRRQHLFDDALIVVVGDHGESLGEGGHFSHAERLDPELVEVPLLIKWPQQKKGRRVDQLVSGVDLFPTVLAAAGVKPPPSHGHALSETGFVSGHGRRFALMEEHESSFHPFFSRPKPPTQIYGFERLTSRRVVWKGGEKCALWRNGGWQSETCDGDGARVLAELRKLLGATAGQGATGPVALSSSDRKALAALGYL